MLGGLYRSLLRSRYYQLERRLALPGLSECETVFLHDRMAVVFAALSEACQGDDLKAKPVADPPDAKPYVKQRYRLWCGGGESTIVIMSEDVFCQLKEN